MEYPGAKFTKPFRLILLGLFIAAFFAISPIVILYSIGYRYDWQAGLLRETGAISIDVEPETAIAYLNNIRLKSKVPIRLNNITPGKYTIRLEADDYLPWLKEVEVKNKQTVYIKEINLIRRKQPLLLQNGNIQAIALSNDGRFLSYALKNNNITEIKLRNTEDNSDTTLITFNSTSSPYLVWAKNKNLLAVSEDKNNIKSVNIFNAENASDRQTLQSAPGDTIIKFQWTNNGGEIYYSLDNNTLNAYNLTSKQDRVLSIEQYADWYLDNSELWIIRPSSTTLQWELVHDVYGYFERALEVDLPEGSKPSILGVKKDTALIKAGANSELTLVYSGRRLNFNADKSLISRYNDWWLFWTASELRTFNYSEEPALLTRSGETLKEVLPLDEYNALLLVWAEKTTIMHPYYLVNTPLLEQTISNPVANTEKRILYFSGVLNKQTGLWQLEY